MVESIEYVRSYRIDLAPLAPRLPTIRTPVTVLAARNDPFLALSDPEHLAQVLPNAQLTVLERGHNAWEEAPLEYAGAISTAIERVD